MAIVFAAHHLLLDRRVALKILSPDLPKLPQLRERFLTEARAAARVESPHVAAVMDVGTLPSGLPFMVLERLDGCDLEELLSVERQLPIGDAVDYVLQALQGLAHAHTLGVIHRDLKPANLFLDHQTDGSAIIKILDFGIAKLKPTDDDGRPISRATQQGQAVGTPMYMSPEHVRNETVDHRTDIWAIGVVLYELLTGKTPFEAEGIGETFGAVLNREAAPAKTLRPDLPDALDAAISKCLERNLDDRWSGVAELARAIAPFGTGACSFLVESIEQTVRQQTLKRQTGKAFLPRPITTNAMSVNVEGAPPSSTKGSAKPLAATIEASTTQVGPIVTPLPSPSQFPQFRPRWGRWALGIAVALGGALAYMLVITKAAPVPPTTATAPVTEPSASALAASASASASPSAAPSSTPAAMATASVPASLSEAIKSIPTSKTKSGAKKSAHPKH